MPGRLLIVDDLPEMRKLVRLKLSAAYFDVVEAASGEEALQIVGDDEIDLILLDVVLPGIDGFETCRRLKSAPETAHIPVVMLSALTQNESKIEGLESGADDFVTKPCDYTSLVTRVNALTRMKMVIDELRLRHAANAGLGLLAASHTAPEEAYAKASIMLICGDDGRRDKMRDGLAPYLNCVVDQAHEDAEINELCDRRDYDCFVICANNPELDPIRVASRLRARRETRNAALMMIFDGDTIDQAHVALEMGISDYVTGPPDYAELAARLKVQLRRKFYSDHLRHSVEDSMAMALTDPLTGLFNRRYVNDRIQAMIDRHSSKGDGLAAMTLDLDHFKVVNDTWGHDVGDAVLKEFADRLRNNLRGGDLVARLGGEEFLVVMPDGPARNASRVADRLRSTIEETPFKIAGLNIEITCSIGLALHKPGEGAGDLLRRSDRALYQSKETGRNKVTLAAA
ncbi:MAG: PleD family two-component system response regulator [Pseudomonadota bacterium]